MSSVLLWVRRALLCSTLVFVTCLPAGPVSSADVIPFSEFDQAGYAGEVAGCMRQYAEPGKDPAGVLPVINAPGAENVYIIYKKIGGNYETKHTGIEGANVVWNPANTTEYEPGVPRVPCVSLYHELVHAHDDLAGSIGDAYCGNSGVPISEVRAIEAENSLRGKLGLKPRTSHGETYTNDPDAKIPIPKLSDCDNDEQRKARESGRCKGVPIGGCSREDANPANPKRVYRDGTPADGSAPDVGATPTGGSASDSAGGPAPAGADAPVATDSSGGPAHAMGDPHLQTFDGRLIDLMSVGEFVLARSADGNMQVQGRFSPLYDSRTVSVVSAIAISSGADRLELTLDNGLILLKHNGKDLNLRANPEAGRFGDFTVTFRLPASAAYSQDAYTINLSDGSQISVELNGASLAVFLRPDQRYRGKLAGLLGDFNADPDDDLRNGSGMVISVPRDTPPTYEQLYRQFGDSWRVTDDTSLFTYPVGQNTATFTDLTFPDRYSPIRDFTEAQQLNARQTCTAFGVTEAGLLDACTVDLLVTGQPTYAAVVALAQNLNTAAQGSGVPPSNTSSPNTSATIGQPLRDGSTVTGQISTAGASIVYDLQLGRATKFFVADWRGISDGCDQVFTIDLVSESTGNMPCTGQQVAFKTPNVGQSHQLQVSAVDGVTTGNYAFTIITAKPRQLSAKPGDAVRGALDIRGREDRYELPQGLKQVHITSDQGCDSDIFAGIYDLTVGDVEALGDPLCRHDLGPYELPDPGHRYAVVVSSPELKTGGYELRVG